MNLKTVFIGIAALATLSVGVFVGTVAPVQVDQVLAQAQYGGETYGGGEYGQGPSDVTAPSLSSPTDSSTGENSGTATVVTDEVGGTLYWVFTFSATSPSAAEVKAQQDHLGATAAEAGSKTVNAIGEQIALETSLTSDTTYFAHFMHEDASGNQSVVVSADGFTTDSANDVTPPILSGISDEATGQTTASVSVMTNEAGGFVYAILSTSPVAPTISQIASGRDVSGNSVPFRLAAVGSAGLITISNWTDLSAGTTYYAHVIHEDVTDNTSAVATGDGFTTSGGASSGGSSGGGGSSSQDEITIDSITALDTSVTITASVEDDATDMYIVLSSTDSTPLCSNAEDTGYITQYISGIFSDSDTVSVTVADLSADTIYYMRLCGEVDGDDESSDSEAFTTTEAGVTTPVTTVPTTPVTTPTPVSPVQTTIPAGYSFDKNVSFIQPSVNDEQTVRYVAQFLNEFENENLVVDSVHSASDDEAVKRFQRKYRREILDVWGLTEATGYVGITTRLKMNFLLKGQTAQCPVFTEYNGGISPITVSPEIQATKQILADLDMYNGPIDQVWTPQTHEAMIVFQETFREVMLDPWNIAEGTGYKYKTTNKFLNYFAGCDTGAIELEGIGVYEGL